MFLVESSVFSHKAVHSVCHQGLLFCHTLWHSPHNYLLDLLIRNPAIKKRCTATVITRNTFAGSLVVCRPQTAGWLWPQLVFVSNVLLEGTLTHSFRNCLWLLWGWDHSIEEFQQNHVSQSHKYFLTSIYRTSVPIFTLGVHWFLNVCHTRLLRDPQLSAPLPLRSHSHQAF